MKYREFNQIVAKRLLIALYDNRLKTYRYKTLYPY